MIRNLAIKVSIFGTNYDDSDKQYVYDFEEWITSDIDDPTSAIKTVKIQRGRNSFVFSALISMYSVKDSDGILWRDKIKQLDTVIISYKELSDSGYTEYPVFFGFISSIMDDENNINDQVVASLVIQCESLGSYLAQPFLNMDQFSDPTSSALSMDIEFYRQLSDLSSGKPDVIMEKIWERFEAFIANVEIVTKNGKVDLNDYLGYQFGTSSILYPSSTTMKPVYGDNVNDFANMLMLTAEINGKQGWLHEIYLDIMSEDEYIKLKDLFVDSNEYREWMGKELPFVGMNKKYYLVVVMRPNPFPYMTIPNSDDVNSVINMQEKILESDKFGYEKEYWEKLLNSDFKFNVPYYYSRHIVKDVNNMKSCFMIDMKINDNGEVTKSVPCVIDDYVFKRKGYDPITIQTIYVEAKTNISNIGPSSMNISLTATRLNLMFASFNSLMDKFGYGQIILPLNFKIKPCSIVRYKSLHDKEFHLAYVTDITHDINIGAKSLTTINVIRDMKESDYAKLEKLFRDRFFMCKTASIKEFVIKNNFPLAFADMAKAVEAK
jgi:hypothetical protein